jgi:hypothetical protein
VSSQVQFHVGVCLIYLLKCKKDKTSLVELNSPIQIGKEGAASKA